MMIINNILEVILKVIILKKFIIINIMKIILINKNKYLTLVLIKIIKNTKTIIKKMKLNQWPVTIVKLKTIQW